MNFFMVLIYSFIATHPYDAQRAFLALSVVNVVRGQLTLMPFVIGGVVQVSILSEYSNIYLYNSLLLLFICITQNYNQQQKSMKLNKANVTKEIISRANSKLGSRPMTSTV